MRGFEQAGVTDIPFVHGSGIASINQLQQVPILLEADQRLRAREANREFFRRALQGYFNGAHREFACRIDLRAAAGQRGTLDARACVRRRFVILLTGGRGFVARHLLRRLAADQCEVRVLSRSPGPLTTPDGVSWVQGDLVDPASIGRALKGVRTVVHAAGVLPGARARPEVYESVNVRGTEALARQAREARVRTFIHISSAGLYGDGSTSVPHEESDTPCPGTIYQRSKLRAELALQTALEESSVSWTILRPQFLYGPDQPATVRLFKSVARRQFWLHGPARALVHPTHVTDLVQAIGLVRARDDLHGEVINVGGGRSLDFRELIALIGARVGRRPIQLSAPGWTRTLARGAARGWKVVTPPPEILTRLMRSWITSAVSIEKARRLLRFEPMLLERGLSETADELRQMGSLKRDA